MGILDPVKPTILAARIISNVDRGFAEKLELKDHQRALALLTCDIDDSLYVALDEATKAADVSVAYARSLYAGSANASTALAGEFIGILSGPDPEEVRSGLAAARRFMEQDACFYTANDAGTVVYFAHCISRTGSFLSKEAGVPEGAALAYLIAPPVEAMMGLDAAVKAADVKLQKFYGPPTETNFAGGLLTGDQAACLAACQAFADTVRGVADAPVDF